MLPGRKFFIAVLKKGPERFRVSHVHPVKLTDPDAVAGDDPVNGRLLCRVAAHPDFGSPGHDDIVLETYGQK
jgi:hypothetical protein